MARLVSWAGLAGLAALAIAGLAPVASAAAVPIAAGSAIKEIGTSPALAVVAQLPDAVSVTFNQPLSSSGAQMMIAGSNGVDIGIGPVGTGANALRRSLREGSPGGPYTVSWQAIPASGPVISGTFRFTAARGNGPNVGPAAPTTIGHPRTGSAAAPTTLAATPGATSATPSIRPTPVATPTSAARPTDTLAASPTPFVFGPSPTQVNPSLLGAQVPRSSDGDGAATGFMLVPITVGALLVVAAGVVSVLSRRRERAARADASGGGASTGGTSTSVRK